MARRWNMEEERWQDVPNALPPSSYETSEYQEVMQESVRAVLTISNAFSGFLSSTEFKSTYQAFLKLTKSLERSVEILAVEATAIADSLESHEDELRRTTRELWEMNQSLSRLERKP